MGINSQKYVFGSLPHFSQNPNVLDNFLARGRIHRTKIHLETIKNQNIILSDEEEKKRNHSKKKMKNDRNYITKRRWRLSTYRGKIYISHLVSISMHLRSLLFFICTRFSHNRKKRSQHCKNEKKVYIYICSSLKFITAAIFLYVIQKLCNTPFNTSCYTTFILFFNRFLFFYIL